MDSIFSTTKIFTYDSKIFSCANRRTQLGNPPGKKGDICDAINWELLLLNVNTDLIIISSDNDYASELDKSQIHKFIYDEWREKKNFTIELYKNLTSFFKKYIPQLKLLDEKRELIELYILMLEGSPNFQTTHNAINGLQDFQKKLDYDQVNRIVDAYLKNSQVNWIINDEDLKLFIVSIMKHYKEFIDKKKFKCLKIELDNAS
jgi:hypothetical protein